MFLQPSKNSLLFKLTFITAACFVWTACQKGELDEIREAQYCLNKAGPGQAESCISGLRSKSSQEASKLVCAGIYVNEGWGSPAELAEAIGRISDGGSCGSSCSGSASAMTTLKFTGATDDIARTKASDAVTYCTRSGVVAYSSMSAMFSIGTLMSVFAPIAIDENSTPLDIENAIDAIPDADLGVILTQTYSASCSDPENISESNQEFCSEMTIAVGATGGSNAAIGACLKHILATPGATACP